MVAVRATDRQETADGYVQSYRVQDRIPVGPLHLRISYLARLHVPNIGDVTAEAYQFPRVRLRTTVTFEPIAAGTRLTEHMHIEAPRALAAMTVREAVEDRLPPLTFLDLDWGIVNRQLEREAQVRRSGPIAENLLRDVGAVAAKVA